MREKVWTSWGSGKRKQEGFWTQENGEERVVTVFLKSNMPGLGTVPTGSSINPVLLPQLMRTLLRTHLACVCVRLWAGEIQSLAKRWGTLSSVEGQTPSHQLTSGVLNEGPWTWEFNGWVSESSKAPENIFKIVWVVIYYRKRIHSFQQFPKALRRWSTSEEFQGGWVPEYSLMRSSRAHCTGGRKSSLWCSGIRALLITAWGKWLNGCMWKMVRNLEVNRRNWHSK